MLEDTGLRFTLINDKIEAKEHTLHFYERNPTRLDMYFDNYPGDKADFVWYAVDLHCLNPFIDIKKSPLSPLKELAEAVDTLLAVGLPPNK